MSQILTSIAPAATVVEVQACTTERKRRKVNEYVVMNMARGASHVRVSRVHASPITDSLVGVAADRTRLSKVV